MEFIKSYLKVYLRAFNFSGVSDVNEYLLFNCVNITLLFILYNFNTDFFSYFFIILILPSLSLTIRRLNDQQKSWTFLFLNSIPYIGSIILFVICLSPTKLKTNKNLTNDNSTQNLNPIDEKFNQIVSSYKNGMFIDVVLDCNDYLKDNTFEIEKENELHYSFEDISEFFYFINGLEDRSFNIVWDKNKYVDLIYYKAMALYELKRHKESIETLINALDYSPVGIKYRFEIVENLIAMKSYKEAMDYLEDLKYSVVKLGDFARLFRRIGLIKIELSNLIDAQICFELSKLFEDNEIANNELKFITKKIHNSNINIAENSYNNFDYLIKKSIERKIIFELTIQQYKTINQLIDYCVKESKNNDLLTLEHTLEIFSKIDQVSQTKNVMSLKANGDKIKTIQFQDELVESASDTIHCPRCNELLSSDSIYCSKCGKRITKNILKTKTKVKSPFSKKYIRIGIVIISLMLLITIYLNVREKQRVQRALDNPELYWVVEATGEAFVEYDDSYVDLQPNQNLIFIPAKFKCVVTEIKANKNRDSFYYIDDEYDNSKIELNLKDFSLYGTSPLISSSFSECLDLSFADIRIKYAPILRNKFVLEEGKSRYILFEIPFATPNDINLKYKDNVIMTYK